MGTPQYMSPEQAERRISDLDQRSDIFSLGAILYAILTLHPPVEGKSVGEVLRKISSGQIAPHRPSD
jgi:serine/threonine protein kinase